MIHKIMFVLQFTITLWATKKIKFINRSNFPRIIWIFHICQFQCGVHNDNMSVKMKNKTIVFCSSHLNNQSWILNLPIFYTIFFGLFLILKNKPKCSSLKRKQNNVKKLWIQNSGLVVTCDEQDIFWAHEMISPIVRNKSLQIFSIKFICLLF